MKRLTLTAIAAAIGLSACTAPENIVQHAANECAMIGYDIDLERVPTLQCTERGYRLTRAAQSTPVRVIGTTAVSAAVMAGVAGGL